MESVYFAPEKKFRQKVERLFEAQKERIQSLLPEADIQHIGSTAIPNSMTKGDLDIQVRIPPERFSMAVDKLSRMYDTNEGSTHTRTFAAFKDDSLDPPLGVQLTVIGGEEDFFWKTHWGVKTTLIMSCVLVLLSVLPSFSLAGSLGGWFNLES